MCEIEQEDTHMPEQTSRETDAAEADQSPEDAAERRRIQNRLNQRAFRQRQRAGEKVKPYKKRNPSASASNTRSRSSRERSVGRIGALDAEDEIEGTARHRLRASQPASEEGSSPTSSPASFPPTTRSPAARESERSELVWDELGGIINRNFVAAVVRNGHYLDIWDDALEQGTIGRIVEPPPLSTPASLQPVELQYQIPHDPIIDSLPFPRLRHNILASISRNEVDADDFCRALRSSGALVQHGGRRQRGGLVVWLDPEEPASWELSEPFVERWASLLVGCEDFFAATNLWRASRGEQALLLPPVRTSPANPQ